MEKLFIPRRVNLQSLRRGKVKILIVIVFLHKGWNDLGLKKNKTIMSLGDMPSRSVFLETQGKKKSVGMRGFGIRQLANQTYFQKLIYMGETNLWEVIRHMFVVSGKPARTPRKAFEVQKVFAFAPPHILCSLCCV